MDVKKKWSFQTGVRSGEVQFAWNPMVDTIFHKLENGFSRQASLQTGSFQTGLPVLHSCMLPMLVMQAS